MIFSPEKRNKCDFFRSLKGKDQEKNLKNEEKMKMRKFKSLICAALAVFAFFFCACAEKSGADAVRVTLKQ